MQLAKHSKDQANQKSNRLAGSPPRRLTGSAAKPYRGDDENDYFLVINTNKQMLTDAPGYAASQKTTESQKTANGTAPSGSDTRTALVRPHVKREG
jgi:hypothetical protein